MVILADIPGFQKGEIKLKVKRREIVISGERKYL